MCMEDTLDNFDNIWLSTKHWISCLVDGTPCNILWRSVTLLKDFSIQPLRLRHRDPIRVDWLQPPTRWIKLNVNGSCRGNPSSCGGGGIIQDENRIFGAGFVKKLEEVLIMEQKFKL